MLHALFKTDILVLTKGNADLNLPLYRVRTWPIPEAEVFLPLERVALAASALSIVAAVCAVEFDTHSRRQTSSNQPLVKTPRRRCCLYHLPLAAMALLSCESAIKFHNCKKQLIQNYLM